MNESITFRQVSKSFGSQTVIDRLDWTLPAVGTICLFGPSGCGKTTLLHLLAGIILPDFGHLEGREQRKISMVFQEPRLLPWLNATHNITAVLQQEDHDQREKTARTWLRRVGLTDAANKLPSELSGGMRQRVAIARALAYGGDLLLLDEPTQGLDRHIRNEIIQLIREQEQERLTVLVTHNREEAAAMQSSVVRLSGPPIRIL